ncbi:hypothetical protein DFJ74DRAFT_665127 [Hyaloraphidium curvatum]|nr:hypothetical protein DFJ74DRAFT_665127 [Hyaloraphidium curvatum]
MGVPSLVQLARFLDDLAHYLRSSRNASDPSCLAEPLQFWYKLWWKEYRPSGETAFEMFRLLAPGEDGLRKYDMQESKLVKHLVSIWGFRGEAERLLKDWRRNGDGSFVAGDLSTAVYLLLKERESTRERQQPRPMSISSVNNLLDHLASHSRFSDDGTGKPPPKSALNQRQILDNLFANASAVEAKWLIRILLKDLFWTTAFREPIAKVLMENFHCAMWRIFQVRSSLELTCSAVEELLSNKVLSRSDDPTLWDRHLSPLVGTCVSIMECEQARSIGHFLQASLKRNFSVSFHAEIKEDGERMQIHINLARPEREQITIFSKSKRNSTWDRLLSHDIIRASLGLPSPTSRSGGRPPAHCPFLARDSSVKQSPPARRTIRHNAILEAELLTWNTRSDRIEEFSAVREFQRSGFRNPDVHYFVCFFDVLYLDDENLMRRPLLERRDVLVSLIVPIPRFAQVVISREFALTLRGADELSHYLVDVLLESKEGLVLKPAASLYRPGKFTGHGWFKLKRDYIVGFSRFEKEFSVVGGSYGERTAARCHPLTKRPLLTVFWLACMLNKEDVLRAPGRVRPHLFLLQSVAFGLSLDDLALLNVQLESSAIPIDSVASKDLDYDLTNSLSGSRIDFLFPTPFVVEVLGSDEGFHREEGNSFYSVRFPRIKRVRNDVQWTDQDCMGFAELQSLARKARTPLADEREYAAERERLRKLLVDIESRTNLRLPAAATKQDPATPTGHHLSSATSSSSSISNDRAVGVAVSPMTASRESRNQAEPRNPKRPRFGSLSDSSAPNDEAARPGDVLVILSSSSELSPAAAASVSLNNENIPTNSPPKDSCESQSQDLQLPLLSPRSGHSGPISPKPRRQQDLSGLDVTTPGKPARPAAGVVSPSFVLRREEENSVQERDIAGSDAVAPENSLASLIRPGILWDLRHAYVYAPTTVRWLGPGCFGRAGSSKVSPDAPSFVRDIVKLLMELEYGSSLVFTLDTLCLVCGWKGTQGPIGNRTGVVLVDGEVDGELIATIGKALTDVAATHVAPTTPPHPLPIAIWDYRVLGHLGALSGDSHTTEDRHEEMLELRERFLVEEYSPVADLFWKNSS